MLSQFLVIPKGMINGVILEIKGDAFSTVPDISLDLTIDLLLNLVSYLATEKNNCAVAVMLLLIVFY